jgi:hypothetical protein
MVAIVKALTEPPDPDQAWFWTPEWQAGEAEADADLAAGRVTTSYSTEEFLLSLRGDGA